MKIAKVLLAIALLVTGFVVVDLGLNCMALAVPELQDGVGYHSILQSTFGLLENTGIDTPADFFHAFRTWVWVTSTIFTANVGLHVFQVSKS